jgi:hypothetical protein
MTTGACAPRGWRRWFAAARGGVPGYRAGATLRRVAGDLRAGSCETDGEGSGHGRLVFAHGLVLAAEECVERQFLMHTVLVRLSLRVPGPVARGHATVMQRGWWRRTGVAARSDAAADAAFARGLAALLDTPALTRALAALDLTYCAIDADERGWTLCVVPFGGSEVVNRMPSFRRYIRVTEAQRDALLAAFQAFAARLAHL